MIRPKFIIVNGLTKKFFERINLIAFTFPWGSIWIHPDWVDNKHVRHHEMVHVAQLNRDGPICMSIKWVYFLFRYKYEDSPYEVEAREKSGI